MISVDKKEELKWILHQLNHVKKETFLISDVIEYKDYATRDVHKWAEGFAEGTEELGIYNKIKDILEARIFTGINEEKVNPQLGIKTLGEFFIATGGKSEEIENGVGIFKVEILPDEAGM